MNTIESGYPFCFFPDHKNSNVNQIDSQDYGFHNWYRFVLSFPPHLVRNYIGKFNLKYGDSILDPFCGTGTTMIEAKLSGLLGIGIEANPMAYFASVVKTNFSLDSDSFLKDAETIARNASRYIDSYSNNKLLTLSEEEECLLITGSISQFQLHKTLILRDEINKSNSIYIDNYLLALATSTVKFTSNLRFGPEVGVSRKKKLDTNVVLDWLNITKIMFHDIKRNKTVINNPVQLHKGDARTLDLYLNKQSINAVFTSPPYPNEKDYTRATRLESVILGFIQNKFQLRDLKKNLLRSNTRNVYKNDDDDKFILQYPEILKIADEIENRRIQFNKTSGFEKLYHKVIKLYFGGIARHLNSLKPFLKNNAMLGYVVGDQASYLRVYIPTGKIIANIAENLGYEIISIDLFRTRFSTVTKKKLNEEVLVLRWKG